MLCSIFGIGSSDLGDTSDSNTTEVLRLTPEEANEKAIDLISNYLVEDGTKVELLNVTEVECGTLYRLEINLSTNRGQQIIEPYITEDGEFFFPSAIEIDEFIAQNQPPKETVGGFLSKGDEICEEDGKPIIYYFGHNRCSHCVWEHPIIENVTSEFEGYISFHDNMDSDADRDVFERYSTGHIPMIVLGCEYYRIGSGMQIGEEEEAKVLTALICNLTEGRPSDLCNEPEIKELMDQI